MLEGKKPDTLSQEVLMRFPKKKREVEPRSVTNLRPHSDEQSINLAPRTTYKPVPLPRKKQRDRLTHEGPEAVEEAIKFIKR